MTSQRQQRIRKIFEACLGEDSPERRAAVINRECGGDAGLESAVVNLLEAHEHSDRPLERLLAASDPDPTIDMPRTVERGGTQIGPYKLREQIGEGGFGVVYLAEQTEPVRRKVALKIIKPGMDTRDVIARFEAERQALALMDHPNIAKVLDAGSVGQAFQPDADGPGAANVRDSSGQAGKPDLHSGRPYFVMELVRGVPITQFCDEQELSTPDRLKLFVDVCRAVQHAHQKGIIHRDIKPSNVMVTKREGRPVVKVIDFGVAKALSQQLTDKTVYTAYGQVVGTPLYMSPEQAEWSDLDVDTRSDVYSLGVLLYRLLTGTTPFAKDTLKKAGYDEMRRLIREVEPPRPSARVTAATSDCRSTVTADRRTEAGKLAQHLRGELDWIAMKALEKDRNRRYQSAAELADDVERFLASQPVEACPPSRFYRFRKFARRNRGLLVTSLIVAVSLIAGTAVATWQWIEADTARILADDRLTGEIAARKEADRERDRARENAAFSRRLLYAADMRLAGDAYRRNDVTRLREVLARHVPASGEDDLRGFEWHFLWKQSGMKLREILKSGDPLYYVCFSAQGDLMAAAGKDALIRIFDGRTFAQRACIASRQKQVNGLAFSPDGRSLASTGDDGTVAIWNVAEGRCRRRIRAHTGLAFQVVYTGDGRRLVSCGRDSAIRVWDPSTGSLVRELKEHRDSVECLSISRGGILAAGCHDGTVSLWDVKTWRPIEFFPPRRSGNVTGIAFSPSESDLAYGHLGGTLSVVDSERLAQLAWQTFPQGLQSLAYSRRTRKSSSRRGERRPRWMAVGDREGNIHLMPVHTDTELSGIVPGTSYALKSRRWAAHRGRVYSVAFAPNGRDLISAGEDGRLLVSTIGAFDGYRRIRVEALGFEFLDANRLVATVRDQPKCAIVDLDRGKAAPASLPTGPYRGREIHVAARSGDVFISDGAGSIVACPRSGRPPGPVWDARKSGRATQFGVSSDGTRLAVSALLDARTKDREFVLLDRATHRVIHREKCDQVHAIRFSPDGRHVAFDSRKCVHVLEAATGRRAAVLSRHKTTINDLQFSPDGRFIGSVSSDRTLKVWEWKTGQMRYSTIAHHNASESLSFSPDGRTIATVGNDGMLRLWRWQLGRMLIEFPLEQWPARRVRFSPDGRRIVVGEEGRPLQVYDGSPVTSG